MSDESFQPADTDGDLLPVVDANDQEIGIRPRRQVHLEGLRHRAVHICVLDPQGRVWLQLRSRAKDSHPLCWDLGCTGHVDSGETYDAAAVRELREELGIEATPVCIGKAEACALTGWEFQGLYVLRWDGAIDGFNTAEIEQMRLFTLDEIQAMRRGDNALGRLTPCVPAQLPRLLRAAGIDPAVLE